MLLKRPTDELGFSFHYYPDSLQDHLNYSSLPPGRPSRSMIYLVKGVVTTVTWLSIISEVSSDELYEKVVPADTADCLKKVRFSIHILPDKQSYYCIN